MKDELDALLKAESKLIKDVHKEYDAQRLRSMGMIAAHSCKMIDLSDRIRIRCKKLVVETKNHFLSEAFLLLPSDRSMLNQMQALSYFHKHTIKAISLETKRVIQPNEQGNMVVLNRLDLTDIAVVEALLRSHHGNGRDKIVLPPNSIKQLSKQYLLASDPKRWAPVYTELTELRSLFRKLENIESLNYLEIILNSGES